MASQSVGGLILILDLLACAKSNELLMNWCLVECVCRWIMPLYAFDTYICMLVNITFQFKKNFAVWRLWKMLELSISDTTLRALKLLS